MDNIYKEFETAIEFCSDEEAKLDGFQPEIKSLMGAVKRIDQSWSQSFIGYHADLYLDGFGLPTNGEVFDSEWGMNQSFSNKTTGNWRNYTFSQVYASILQFANLDETMLRNLEQSSKHANSVFVETKDKFIAIIAALNSEGKDNQLAEIVTEIKEYAKAITHEDLAMSKFPKGGYATRDALASSQGAKLPHHKQFMVELEFMIYKFHRCCELRKLLARAQKYIKTKASLSPAMTPEISTSSGRTVVGKKVFIGHGKSIEWTKLKEFLSNRLKLEYDEYNRVSAAGLATKERLEQMVGDAAFAFIVMTAEDLRPDGKLHPRENVIHEAGLFQGKLGFLKAIILLEDGCEEFSNIVGLTQIRFPKDNINAATEEIRKVLEREGILASNL